MPTLLEPACFGAIELANRVVMAPMTRSRADTAGNATDLMAEYYGARASAGLIVTEGIAPSESGKGYCRTPVLDSPSRLAGWRAVTDAVHAGGGKIVAQAMHCGRVAHAANKAPGAGTVAPSAIRAAGLMYTDGDGMQPFDEPRALSASEIGVVVNEYRRFASLAMEAGFDGVELHGTSGYLPAQFLCTGTNRRSDGYGGSVEGRIRFPVEVLGAIVEEIDSGRTGLRICPGNPFNDLVDDRPEDVEETFRAFLAAIRPLGLAWLHVIRRHEANQGIYLDNLALARELHDGALIANDSYDGPEATKDVSEGVCDAVSFGRHFLATTDLPARLAGGRDPESFDPRTLYTPGPLGYTDLSRC
ncbi:MAG: alkene reductase [Acidimicrobiales bacterium]|nr:alkene reductase [Acidimicrobiales bacterium]